MKPAASRPARRSATPTGSRFEEYLAAADVVACDLLLEEGIAPHHDSREHELYFNGVNALAERFGHPFKDSDVDDHMTHQEYFAKIEAAHMIGLALGRRLRDADLGTVPGGAR